MRFSADDRREMLRLLCEVKGYSKAKAKATFDVLSPVERGDYLRALRGAKSRMDEAPAPFVSIPRPSVEERSQETAQAPNAAHAKPLGRSRSKKVPYTLLMQPEQLEALKACSEADGETVSHHIRQAIRDYLSRVESGND